MMEGEERNSVVVQVFALLFLRSSSGSPFVLFFVSLPLFLVIGMAASFLFSVISQTGGAINARLRQGHNNFFFIGSIGEHATSFFIYCFSFWLTSRTNQPHRRERKRERKERGTKGCICPCLLLLSPESLLLSFPLFFFCLLFYSPDSIAGISPAH